MSQEGAGALGPALGGSPGTGGSPADPSAASPNPCAVTPGPRNPCRVPGCPNKLTPGYNKVGVAAGAVAARQGL